MMQKQSLGLEAMSCNQVEKSLHISFFEYEIGRINILHFNTRIEHGKIDV